MCGEGKMPRWCLRQNRQIFEIVFPLCAIGNDYRDLSYLCRTKRGNWRVNAVNPEMNPIHRESKMSTM